MDLSLVYSCSGCSSAAQMANDLAVRLDHDGIAEMSCIAGVGGDVKPLVDLAKSGRKIIAIDGCPLKCVQNCLARHELKADLAVSLNRYKVKKKFHEKCDDTQVKLIYEKVVEEIKVLG